MMSNQQGQKVNGAALKKRYDELLSILALDTTNWDPRTLPGIEGRKNSAKIEIEGVKMNLAQAVLLNSQINILLRDYEGTDQLVAAAKTDLGKNILLDYLSLEKGMYREIFGAKEGGSFNSEIINRMNMLLISVGDKIGAISFPALSANSTQYGTVKTRQAMIEKMEQALESTFNYELKDLFLASIIKDQVLERLGQGSLNLVLVNTPVGFVDTARALAGRSQVLSNDNPLPKAAPVTAKPAATSEAAAIAALIKPRKPRAKKVEEVTTETDAQENVDEQ